MTNTNKQLPILLPSKGPQRYFVRALYSLTNFAKASILSIVIILVVLLLLTRMEQAFTMLLRMLEDDRISLAVCFLMVNLLAVSLSHFPIYTYYAGNLNGSRGHILWKKEYPIKIKGLRWISVYSFTLERSNQYVRDIYFNILRNFLGLFVFTVWIHFIYSTFEPKFLFILKYPDILQGLTYGLLFMPFIIYGYTKRKLSPQHSTAAERKRIYRRIGVVYFITLSLSILFFFITLFSDRLFSLYGFSLLWFTTFFMMFNYAFFRLVRPRLFHVLKEMKFSDRTQQIRFLKIIKAVGRSSNYLVVFQLSFYICFIAIIYFNLASVNGWILPNGLSIVLVYLYFYFFLISAIGKFYFVYYSIAQRQFPEKKDFALDKNSFKFLTRGIAIFVLLFVFGLNTETSLNELDQVPIIDHQDGTTLEQFESQIDSTASNTLYFVSSHGGGTKAYVWTLHVLQELQKRSKGNFLRETVAMSGASGGSLGLALYGDLYGTCKGNLLAIDKMIGKIEKTNYASIDVSMVLGLDVLRLMWPLNNMKNSKDRAYYDMLKYQNDIRNVKSSVLCDTAFRTYWKNLQKGIPHFNMPILIMNTSSTSGKRGIFFSLNTQKFNQIFPYAKDLAEIQEISGKKKSISFYQAVSTTNRFPVFSPVAKIKGSGHYIDAGAIDNSGILGCLDVFLYFRQQNKLADKKIVFLDIDNSKLSYAEHLLQKFIQYRPKLRYEIDENEKTSVVANLQTGLSLNKIPGYLNDFMRKFSNDNAAVHFKQIFLPHKISIEDIETVLDAKIMDSPFRRELLKFLTQHNEQILEETEDFGSFFSKWKHYDPVLCLQLSYSNIAYMRKMKKSILSGIPSVFGTEN